ncbi:MAG TPA: TolC family protein [Terracidiphilus sp.]|nr:TolC family protein [Terracidiphilus sp.]
MHLFDRGVLEQQDYATQRAKGKSGSKLRALAAAVLTLAATVPPGYAQQAGTSTTPADKASSGLPSAPAPELTKPMFLLPTTRDFTKPAGRGWGDPINWYRPTNVAKANFVNSVRLDDLVKDGKIYLSLSDAIALAIENNYDIAIARYNLDIADTDILRTRAGALPLGVNTGLVTNTQGGTSTTLTAGGGPGGTTGGQGGEAAGASGLVLTTSGAGPVPELLDPSVTGTLQWERARQPQANTLFSGGKSSLTTNTNQYNFTYNQGFVTGTALTATITNTRTTTDNPFTVYSPQLSSVFKATLTQHLLYGAGIYINKRFMYQALNDRRITDSSFRQQVLYTVNQVESIYWGLVSAYEDVQAKERALAQSTKVDEDTRKQLQIGTMAPLDVVNADSTVATDKQSLISSQSNLKYQQQVIKQAIARNLNDPKLEKADVIPTDRVDISEIPEESQPVDELVQTAFKQRPELEENLLQLKNDEITLKGARNGLLPTLDLYGFYGSNALGGGPNPDYNTSIFGGGSGAPSVPTTGYGSVLQGLFNSSAPDKGVGLTLNIPIRNREAQAEQARSLLEYRQAELRVEQLYTQIRMQVVNAQFALTNDRAQVKAAIAAREANAQSLEDEEKKLHLGASTTANVLLQERNLATAEDSLIEANAAYARDRAGLYQVLATTLQHYGINLDEAATGNVTAAPVIPGLQPAPKEPEATTAPPPTGR